MRQSELNSSGQTQFSLRRLSASIMGRMSAITADSYDHKLRKRASQSFAVSYLLDGKTTNSEFKIDVELTNLALLIARNEGEGEAIKFIDDINFTANKPLISSIISRTPSDENILISRALYDQFLLTNSLPDEHLAQIRLCYESVMASNSISLPFTKSTMSDLLRHFPDSRSHNEIVTFKNLKDFIWEFLLCTWPLFDASVLHIPIEYFNLKKAIRLDQIVSNLERMSVFGLDRLLSRMVALRAVNGQQDDIKAFSDPKIRAATQFDDVRLEQIDQFLAGNGSGIVIAEIPTDVASNPIERAIFLSIYIYERANSFDLLRRLTDAFEYDDFIFNIINWNLIWSDFEDSSYYLSPELIFIASTLLLSGALDATPDLRAQYIPTGAETDLDAYARECGQKKNMTAHQFFASFASLPKAAKVQVFRYLLRPGVLDNVVYAFSKPTAIVASSKQNEASLALSTKLDCISYIKTNKILPGSHTRPIESECRRILRHIKFEIDTGTGRIRLNKIQFTNSIRSRLEMIVNEILIPDSALSDERLRQAIASRNIRICSSEITQWVCFECRFAFDYLLSNLRHNFLRFRVETGIEKAFEGVTGFDFDDAKIAAAEVVERFNQRWLTIDAKRSFFSGLQEQIAGILKEGGGVENWQAPELMSKISNVSIVDFDDLLCMCQRQWSEVFRVQTLEAIMRSFDGHDLSQHAALSDKLESGIDEAFEESSMWISVNDTGANPDFGLMELFEFEATIFSTAKTRSNHVQISRFDNSAQSRNMIFEDLIVRGEYLDSFVILIQNILENAIEKCGLPKSEVRIAIDIISKHDSVVVEFRNRFDSERRAEMRVGVRRFNERVGAAERGIGSVPLESGGSGVRRIIYEFGASSLSGFSIEASAAELSRDWFLVRCVFPKAIAAQGPR
jgi:hypothetical protein